MDDAGFVRVMQGLGRRRTEFDRFSNRERMGLDLLVQCGSVDEVAGDVDQAVLALAISY